MTVVEHDREVFPRRMREVSSEYELSAWGVWVSGFMCLWVC